MLDNMTKKELFDFLNLFKKNHSDPERKKVLETQNKLHSLSN